LSGELAIPEALGTVQTEQQRDIHFWGEFGVCDGYIGDHGPVLQDAIVNDSIHHLAPDDSVHRVRARRWALFSQQSLKLTYRNAAESTRVCPEHVLAFRPGHGPALHNALPNS